MKKHPLDALFQPESVAVIGASERAGSIGRALVENLVKGGFEGGIYPLNPKYQEIQGLAAHPDIGSLGTSPDLAVIAIPIKDIPGVMRQCGAAGVGAAIIISTGGRETGPEGEPLEADILAAARETGIRYLGPGSWGVLSPAAKLAATFAPMTGLAGNLAFVSQSGALCSSVLGWATRKNIGFSHFISVGSKTDLDFADLIDYSVLVALVGCGGGSPSTPTPAPSPTPPAGRFEYDGGTHVSWWHDEYGTPAGTDSRRALAATGAGWAGLLTTWYMETKASSTIAPHPDQSNDDDVVRRAIDEMHALGLKVMLKPHVDVRDGTWRAQITPADPGRWFESYAAFMDHYVAIAAEKNVALLCIGTELASMSGADHDLRAASQRLRRNYGRQVTEVDSGGLHEDQTDAPGCQQRFEQAPIEKPNNGGLQQPAGSEGGEKSQRQRSGEIPIEGFGWKPCDERLLRDERGIGTPIIINSPWAMLMTPINPNSIANPMRHDQEDRTEADAPEDRLDDVRLGRPGLDL